MGHHHPSYDHGKVQATELLGCAENHLHSILNITNHCNTRSPKGEAARKLHKLDRSLGFSFVAHVLFPDTPQTGIFNTTFAIWGMPQT